MRPSEGMCQGAHERQARKARPVESRDAPNDALHECDRDTGERHRLGKRPAEASKRRPLAPSPKTAFAVPGAPMKKKPAIRKTGANMRTPNMKPARVWSVKSSAILSAVHSEADDHHDQCDGAAQQGRCVAAAELQKQHTCDVETKKECYDGEQIFLTMTASPLHLARSARVSGESSKGAHLRGLPAVALMSFFTERNVKGRAMTAQATNTACPP